MLTGGTIILGTAPMLCMVYLTHIWMIIRGHVGKLFRTWSMWVGMMTTGAWVCPGKILLLGWDSVDYINLCMYMYVYVCMFFPLYIYTYIHIYIYI